MNKTEKQQVIDELSSAFASNKGLLVMSFSGLNVENVTELRRRITQSGSDYKVVKNTLAIRAAENTTVAQLKPYFEGPTAIAYTTGDAVGLAKILTDFVKSHPEIKFKAGVVENSVLTAEQCQTLAEMPSREVLLGKVLFLLNAPLSRLAGTLQSPLTKLAFILKQLGEKPKGNSEE